MSVMTPVPKDDPLMIAWEAYKATEDYANTLKWAPRPEHTEGSLWTAFLQGWTASGERYFLGHDNDAHAYVVPVSKRDEWNAWRDIPESDERSWEVPEYAKRVDGRLTFTDPRVDG